MSPNQYWPTLTGADLAAAVMERFREFEEAFRERDLPRMRIAALTYYGEDADGGSTHEIGRAGTKDQIRILKDNEYRAIVTNKLTIATSEPAGFLPVPVNTDSDSQATSLITRGVLDYYFDEGKIDAKTYAAAEIAEVLGWAYVDVGWERDAGPVVQELPLLAEPGQFQLPTEASLMPGDAAAPAQLGPDQQIPGIETLRGGEPEVTPLLPCDRAFDYDARGDCPWVIIRHWRNKWDVAAGVADPELRERIQALTYGREQDEVSQALRGWNGEGTKRTSPEDEIPVYELRHVPTAACPEGRFALVLASDLIIEEGPAPFDDDLGVYRIAQAERFGTPRAYTSGHDMLGLQRAVDTVTSIPYSNQAALGLNIIVSRDGAGEAGGGNGLSVRHLMEGLVHIEYSGGEENKPETLALANTPKEIFPFREDLKKSMATKAGMDNLSMGREDRDLSGAAMALLDSRTQRAVSQTAKAYAQLRLDVANALLRRFKQFARESRELPLLVGKYKRPMLAQFSGSTFEGIDRVRLETISPLMRSPAGRLELAGKLIEAKGAGVEPEMIMAVIETGKYEALTEAPMAMRILIREENEHLQEGIQIPPALWTDHPMEHVREHNVVLNSMAARNDPNIIALVREHLESHMPHLMAWANGDLIMLSTHGPPPQEVIAAVQMQMAPPGAPGASAPGSPGSAGGTLPPKPGATTEAAPPAPGQPQDGPRMPTNPATGEAYTPTGEVANG